MTMLDRMRRHKNWLKWSLALVVLTFIVFYIPDFLRGTSGSIGSSDAIAEVDGRRITSAEFSRAYNMQVQAYRNAYGGSMNEALLRQLGIDRQILQQLIDERAALAEAERLGISVSDAEVRERIVRLPAFQENGQFVGEARYKQVLRMQRPPVTHTEFEQGIGRSILFEKLRNAITGWMSVADAEVDREYRQRNERIKVEVVALTADAFMAGLSATDQELAQYFEANKEQFRIGERRKVRFINIDATKIRDRVNVAPIDVERYYNGNIDQYSSPETVRASHILLKTEGKDEAAVRKQAEDLLAKVRAGADFAALARQYSEDEASKPDGGDLDFFARGRMVPEFEQVAFALEPGAISDLVKTQFGFHIIKVIEKRPAAVKSLEEVRPQITELLRSERAQTQASDLANKVASEISKPDDFERVAKANGLTVQETGFFLRDEPIAGLGPTPQLAAEAFGLNEGDVSGLVPSGQGSVIFTVTGKQDSRLPALDEVKDRVREAVLRKKALDAARAKADSLAASLGTAGDFEAAAKAAGLATEKSADFVARGSALPGIGTNAQAEGVAFGLPAGGVSGPLTTDNAVAIIKVTERQDVTAEQIAAGRATLREEMLNERRGRFFSSYMGKAKQRMKITIHRDALQRLLV